MYRCFLHVFWGSGVWWYIYIYIHIYTYMYVYIIAISSWRMDCWRKATVNDSSDFRKLFFADCIPCHSRSLTLVCVCIVFWQRCPWISGAKQTNQISAYPYCQSKGWNILYHRSLFYFPDNSWGCVFFLKFIRHFTSDLGFF